MDFIRLVTWPRVERFSRKGYEGPKIIYVFFLNFDTRIIIFHHQQLRFSSIYHFILFIIFLYFIIIFFCFSSPCDSISYCEFTSSFEGFFFFSFFTSFWYTPWLEFYLSDDHCLGIFLKRNIFSYFYFFCSKKVHWICNFFFVFG